MPRCSDRESRTAFLYNYELSKLGWPRRQNLPSADRCGIARIRMDPLAVLRFGFLGNGVGNPVCAALSATVDVHGAEAHPCCARYSADRPDDSNSAVDADLRIVAAGRVQRVREDPVGRAEYRPVFSAGLWRITGMGDRSAGPLWADKPRLDARETVKQPDEGQSVPCRQGS